MGHPTWSCCVSLAKNLELLRQLPKLDGFRLREFGLGASVSSPLEEVTGFGSNPGQLRMYSFVRRSCSSRARWSSSCTAAARLQPLTISARDGPTLANHYGFALVMPEQQRANNANTCFNWFNTEDITRDSGEAQSIREMIAHMAETHGIDARRVFITGLSAGGGMTSVMLATYPEVFAAGAVVAGLPYGIATNLREALDGMFHSPDRPARELGDLVRQASSHRGPWPKISVWHGSADRTVNPGNANAIIKQWLDLHGLPGAPMAETIVDGYPRQTWWTRTAKPSSNPTPSPACRTAPAWHGRQRSAIWRRRRLPD